MPWLVPKTSRVLECHGHYSSKSMSGERDLIPNIQMTEWSEILTDTRTKYGLKQDEFWTVKNPALMYWTGMNKLLMLLRCGKYTLSSKANLYTCILDPRVYNSSNLNNLGEYNMFSMLKCCSSILYIKLFTCFVLPEYT